MDQKELELEVANTMKDDCGHNWNRREWIGCPVCALMEGDSIRINDLEVKLSHEKEKNEKLQNALYKLKKDNK